MEFKKAVDLVIELEGGETVTNHAEDPGGLTKWGISARAFPMLDIEELTRTEAEMIYWDCYWEAVKAEKLPALLRLFVFDTAVNMGVFTAAKMLQTVLSEEHENLVIDGRIGPKTIKASHRSDQEKTLLGLTDIRMDRYRRIVTFDTFGKGWTNRVNKILEVTRAEALSSSIG